ncbi:MAG: hypothetical protein MJ106_00580 [Lentisphaeria bacterium]|nr:hypothetical protein [Lentisphaeria bacterium]
MIHGKLIASLLILSSVMLCATDAVFSATPSSLSDATCVRKVADWIGGAKANIGIQGKDFRFVGNPNSLNRCDRVVFTIDIRTFLYDGKVKEAVLEYKNEPFGVLEENEIGLDWITSGRLNVRPEDIIASDSETVCNYAISRQSPQFLKIDVTALVNKALAVGDGYITFRVLNVSTETRGNPKSTAEGICIPHDSVRLLVTRESDSNK